MDVQRPALLDDKHPTPRDRPGKTAAVRLKEVRRSKVAAVNEAIRAGGYASVPFLGLFQSLTVPVQRENGLHMLASRELDAPEHPAAVLHHPDFDDVRRVIGMGTFWPRLKRLCPSQEHARFDYSGREDTPFQGRWNQQKEEQGCKRADSLGCTAGRNAQPPDL